MIFWRRIQRLRRLTNNDLYIHRFRGYIQRLLRLSTNEILGRIYKGITGRYNDFPSCIYNDYIFFNTMIFKSLLTMIISLLAMMEIIATVKIVV